MRISRRIGFAALLSAGLLTIVHAEIDPTLWFERDVAVYLRSLPARYLRYLEALHFSRTGDYEGGIMDKLKLPSQGSGGEKADQLLTQLQCLNPPGFSLKDIKGLLKILQKYAIEEMGTSPCRATRDEIPLEELDRAYRELLQIPNMQPDFMGVGVCDLRGLIISKFLDDRGIKSKQLYIYPPIVAPHRRSEGFDVRSYNGFHVVTTVKVRDFSGRVREYVLDPAHTDGPLPLEEYANNVFFDAKKTHHGNQVGYYQTAFGKFFKPAECKYDNYGLNQAANEMENDITAGKRISDRTEGEFATREEALTYAKFEYRRLKEAPKQKSK
jgi:hypothetical protein